jgi:hypothetical protein
MDDNNFQQLWWSLEEARNAAKQLSLVKAVAVHRTFQCSQIVSLVDLMQLVGDKLTVVEMLCLRTADPENKQRIIEVFPLAHQALVKKIMLNAYGTAQDHKRHHPHLVKHMATQTSHDMKVLNTAVDNAAFSTNCMDILRSTLRKSTTGISFQSAFQLMMRFKDDDVSEVSIEWFVVHGLWSSVHPLPWIACSAPLISLCVASRSARLAARCWVLRACARVCVCRSQPSPLNAGHVGNRAHTRIATNDCLFEMGNI